MAGENIEELLEPLVRNEVCPDCGSEIRLVDGRGFCEGCQEPKRSPFDHPAYRLAVHYWNELREAKADPSLVAGMINHLIRFSSRAAERKGIDEARREASRDTMDRLEDMRSAVTEGDHES